MPREIRFINRSLINGLFNIFSASPFFAICTFLIILVISSVIPLAFIWLIQCFIFDFSLIPIKSSFLRTIFTLWSIAEVIFFIYQCHLYFKIQRRTFPPYLTSEERDELLSYALVNVKDVPNTLRKWFLDCPFEDIDRESIIGWLGFVFYSKHTNELNADEYQEISLFIDKIEIQHQLKAAIEKRNKNIAYMKHNLEHVRVIFRPLVFYFVTDTILNGILAKSILYLYGYQFVQIGCLQFWTYYNRSKDADDEEPIIFFHGLGIGPLQYLPLISWIQKHFSQNRRIILVSMRCISMRYPSLNDIPTMTETADSIKMIFERYKLTKAIFIGHSFGTACLSWIVQKCPEHISRLIFIDPICFSLFEPYVLYNFIYRTPYKLGHLYMYYFVCREMGISYVVSRHFWWTQNILYIEQLRSCSNKNLRIYALLSGRDCIVNAHVVKDYLTNYNIEYHWAPNVFHGGFAHDKDSWKKFREWIS